MAVSERQLNRVKLDVDGKPTVYDLDRIDAFWAANRGRPFPVVATNIEEALASYKERQKKINDLKGGISADSDAGVAEALAQSTANLNSAISSLGDMVEQKKKLDMHTEEEILNKKSLSRPVLEIISQCGNPHDKLRLYLMYVLDNDLPADQAEACEAALREAGCDMNPIAWVQSVKKFQKTFQQGPIAASHGDQSLFSQASKMMKLGGDLWKQGVKKLVPTSGDLAVTVITEALMDLKSSPLVQDYLYLDPRILKFTPTTTVPKGRPPFEEAIVFIVGGGNYIEYQNLQDFCARPPAGRRITYGTSLLLSPGQFVEDMSKLGAKSAPAH